MAKDIRLLLDQGLPRDAAALLRNEGWDCLHVGELGMARAEDTAIVEFAREHDAAIVTLDADFHALLATSRASTPSVIRLRLQGLGGADVATHVAKVMARFATELAAGCLVTVKSNKTTCHRLPTGGGE
jgi:predicted nuclease of predicted toxin-antitoxin system